MLAKIKQKLIYTSEEQQNKRSPVPVLSLRFCTFILV